MVILFVLGLILTGIAMFLWVGVYKELSYSGAPAIPKKTNRKPMKKPPLKEKTPSSPKEKKFFLSGLASIPKPKIKKITPPNQSMVELTEEDDHDRFQDWSNFNPVKREQRQREEPDDLYHGFSMKPVERETENHEEFQRPNQRNADPDINPTPSGSTNSKQDTFKRNYAFLYEEEEEEADDEFVDHSRSTSQNSYGNLDFSTLQNPTTPAPEESRGEDSIAKRLAHLESVLESNGKKED